MKPTKKLIPAVLYIMLVVLCSVPLVVTLVETAKADGNCIYATYRIFGGCLGATTRLCEGPPNCPVVQ